MNNTTEQILEKLYKAERERDDARRMAEMIREDWIDAVGEPASKADYPFPWEENEITNHAI